MGSMDRRRFLQSAIANLSAVALGGRISSPRFDFPEKARQGTATRPSDSPAAGAGPLREFPLVLEKAQFEIPGRGIFEKWLYNGQFPGPEIRAKEGERLRVAIKNNLPEGTTVHWHGIPLQNAMDGVPDITQPAIPPGGGFIYEFNAAPAGSYMYHSHVGLQQDRGLVGPLVVGEKNAHIAYDREYTLTLTDFLAGAPAPLGRMKAAGSATMDMLAPPYIALLINGRPPEAPSVFQVKSGERVRLRLINPSGTTIYRFAIGGHPLTITHTDGRPVEPFRVDALRFGPGERYDVLVEARNPGAWPIAASPDNDLPAARAVLQYIDANPAMPRADAMPEGLTGGRLLQLEDLRGLDVPEVRKPNRIFNFVLAGGMLKLGGMMNPGSSPPMLIQEWTMNGQAYPNAEPLEIHRGEAVRIRLENQSAMPHPMHLHGHFYRVGNVSKDTTIVWAYSKKRVELDLVADNPGAWLFHCHNLYHMDGGMMRVVRYV